MPHPLGAMSANGGKAVPAPLAAHRNPTASPAEAVLGVVALAYARRGKACGEEVDKLVELLARR
jgi:hypothetical protein